MQYAKRFDNNKDEACKCESNDECNRVEYWQCKDSVAVGCKCLKRERREGKGKTDYDAMVQCGRNGFQTVPHARRFNSSKAEHASARVVMNATNIQCWICQHSLTAGCKRLKQRGEGRGGKGKKNF